MLRLVELEDGTFRLEIRLEIDGIATYHEVSRFEKLYVDDTIPEKSGGYRLECAISLLE